MFAAATKTKQVASTAANYIEDVFSTYLYQGTSINQFIPNGINLVNTAAWFTTSLVLQNYSIATALAVDSNNNCYVGGIYGTSTTGFISKYNSSGVLQWQRKLSQNGSSYGYGIALDSSNNVFITGQLTDSTRSNMLVAKYNTSGTLQWQRNLYENSGSSG